MFIKNTGIRFASFNGPTWYISSMLLNMLILYPLIRKLKDNFWLIAIPVFLFLGGYFFQTYGTLSNLEDWNGIVLNGTLRGTYTLLAGCICYKIALGLRKIQFSSWAKICLWMIEWGSYITAVVLMNCFSSSKMDFFIVFLFIIGISITYSENTFDGAIFKSKSFKWIGSLSYSIYISHSCWREFTSNIFPITWTFSERLICYVVLSIWSGLFIHYLSELIRAIGRFVKLKRKSI